MSWLQKYTEGWSFRSNKPSFDAGEEISVFVTGVEDGVPVANVGDSKLRVTDAPSGIVEKRVLLRVTSFDGDAHTGEAEYVETVGDSAF